MLTKDVSGKHKSTLPLGEAVLLGKSGLMVTMSVICSGSKVKQIGSSGSKKNF